MSDLNLNEFLKVFNMIWEGCVTSDDLRDGLHETDALNTLMLSAGGVLSKIAVGLTNDLDVYNMGSCHGFDAMYTSKYDYHFEDEAYPKGVKALVKCANDDDIMESAWLLAHWRSPLKILIFQDWIGTGNEWVNTKLTNIYNFLDSVDDFNVESEITEYLFLAAFKGYGDDVPKWYWSSTHQRDLRILTGDGALDRAKVIAKRNERYGVNLPQKFEYSFELHQPYEDAISLHGALHRKINKIVDSINEECKQAGLSVGNSCVSISNIENNNNY